MTSTCKRSGIQYFDKPSQLGSVDIWGHVILSDQRERRISLEPYLTLLFQFSKKILRRFSHFASFAPQNDMFIEMSIQPNPPRALNNP
jgi:hypothetical protein